MGLKTALVVLLTGLATVAGGWLAARTALGGGVQAAGTAMARLILAMVFKWVLIIAALVLGLRACGGCRPWGCWRVSPSGSVFQVLALAKR